MRLSDEAFVYSAWTKGFQPYHQDPKVTLHRHIQSILARAEVRIAALADDPDTNLGFLVFEPGIIHYAYVKGPFRRMHVFRTLLGDLDPNTCIYTHRTPICSILAKKWPGARYCPQETEPMLAVGSER